MSAGWIVSARLGCTTALGRVWVRAALGIAAGTWALSMFCAWAERQAGAHGCADRLLQGVASQVIVPLSALAVVTAITRRGRLDDALQPAAIFGARKRAAAIGMLVTGAAISAVIGAGALAFGALAAHRSASHAVLHDCLSCVWIGALAAVTYSCLFFACSTVGRRGWARWLGWGADVVASSAGGVAAVSFPRAHVLNLLGGDHPVWLSQPMSVLALVVLIAAYSAITALRVGE